MKSPSTYLDYSYVLFTRSTKKFTINTTYSTIRAEGSSRARARTAVEKARVNVSDGRDQFSSSREMRGYCVLCEWERYT